MLIDFPGKGRTATGDYFQILNPRKMFGFADECNLSRPARGLIYIAGLDLLPSLVLVVGSKKVPSSGGVFGRHQPL